MAGIKISQATEVAIDNLNGNESIPISKTSGSAERAKLSSIRGFVKQADGIVFNIGTKKYILHGAEELQTPDAPTLSLGTIEDEHYRADGNSTVNITNPSSGTIYYIVTSSVNNEPINPIAENISTTSSSGTITLNQDNSNQWKWYKIVAKAYKNGLWSSASNILSIRIYRKLTAPTIDASGNNYSNSRTITITVTNGVTIEYKIGQSGSYVTYDSSNEPIINSTSTIYARVSETGWVSAESSLNVTVGRNKCYIGQSASISSITDIKSLSNSYDRDTLVGYTASEIDFGSTTQYVWFCIPSTAAKNLSVTSGAVPVPLDNDAGTVVSTYRVWRTSSKINSAFTFKFE